MLFIKVSPRTGCSHQACSSSVTVSTSFGILHVLLFHTFLSSREIQHIPRLLAHYFSIPKVEFTGNSNDNTVGTTLSAIHWNQKSLSCIAFLKALTASEDINQQVHYLQQLSSATQILLKDTILINEVMVVYCYIRCHLSMGFVNGSVHYFRVGSSDPTWCKILAGCSLLATFLDV